MRMQMVNYSWVNLLSWSVRWDPRCQMRSVLWKWRVEFGYPSSKAPSKTGCVYGSVTTGCVTKVLNISRKTNWLLNFQWNFVSHLNWKMTKMTKITQFHGYWPSLNNQIGETEELASAWRQPPSCSISWIATRTRSSFCFTDAAFHRKFQAFRFIPLDHWTVSIVGITVNEPIVTICNHL